ncbi:PPOX class F420-dependent oxidoreductase [Streptomonospora algeriensis]|uniref:PPOX class F420-dependent oxidoreductase n=1 Tax=Streptomonospora algeriensis TaxID=995084 RepID=A0ABW3BEB3_9ACTN
MTAATLLKPFQRYKTALLLTYRDDGVTPQSTAVSVAVEDGRVLFRTWEESGKAKRLARNANADLRPCTFNGKPRGSAVRGEVRPLEGDEAERASLLLARRHPMLQGWAVPMSHKLMKYRTRNYEFVPLDLNHDIENMEGCPD